MTGGRLVTSARAVAALLGIVAVLIASAAEAGTAVRVIVPKRENLQYLNFWIAKGAGYFQAEGIDLEQVQPSASETSGDLFRKHVADVALLPPSKYLPMLAEGVPLVLVANLLENDGINVIVRRAVAEARGLRADAPLRERLERMRGLKVGVAHGPPTRLRALFKAQGLDADRDIEMVIVSKEEQNVAFGDGRADALYAHSPFAEKALLEQDGVLVVNQSAGEVPELAHRQIFALVMDRAFLDAHRDVAVAMTRALQRAQTLVHTDRAAATRAVLAAFPAMDSAHVSKVVEIYEPAIPKTPRVYVDRIPTAAELFPATKARPDLAQIDLAKHVFVDDVAALIMDAAASDKPPPGLEAKTPARTRWTRWGLVAMAGALVLALTLATLSFQQRRSG